MKEKNHDKKMIEKVTMLDESIKTLTEELGRKVTIDELAVYMGMTEEEIELAIYEIECMVDEILKEINQIYLKGIKIEDINLSSKTQGLKLLYVLKLLTDQSDMFEDASEIKRNYLYSLDIKDDSISKELCEKKRVRDYEIKLYLKMQKINPNYACAIGNDYNDISMFKEAGIGIAVSNACKDALNAADYITVSNEEHAIARVIYDLENGKYNL